MALLEVRIATDPGLRARSARGTRRSFVQRLPPHRCNVACVEIAAVEVFDWSDPRVSYADDIDGRLADGGTGSVSIRSRVLANPTRAVLTQNVTAHGCGHRHRGLCERLLGEGGGFRRRQNERDLEWSAGAMRRSLVADVSTEAGNAAIVKAAVDRFGGLDGVVFNAGVLRNGSIETMSVDDYRLMHDVNVNGCILGMRAAIPALRQRGRGAMVATASIGGFRGARDGWGYGATKAAIINLVKSVPRFGQYCIRVTRSSRPTRDTACSTVSTSASREPRSGADVSPCGVGAARRIAAVMRFLLSTKPVRDGCGDAVDGGVTAWRCALSAAGVFEKAPYSFDLKRARSADMFR